MKKSFQRILLSLFVLCAALIPSAIFGQSVTFTGHYIELDAKTSDGKPALKIHYDANVRGCYGHTIQIGAVIYTEDGKNLTDNSGNSLFGLTSQEIHYNNANLNDRCLTIPYSKFKVYSGRNTYYYKLYAHDKITEDYLGESDYGDFEMVGKTNSNNSNNSNKKNNAPKRSASFSDVRFLGAQTSKGETAFNFFYDVNLKACNGRKVKIQVSFTDSNGNYLYGKDGKKLIWSQSIDVKSDNIKYTDQKFLLSFSQLNISSSGKTYYFQFAAFDDKTGDCLGQSEKKSLFLGNSIAFKNQRVTYDEYDNGKPVISYYCSMDYMLPEGHDVKLVCALETNQDGRRHHYPDGREMTQEEVWKNSNKSTSGSLNIVMGFDQDEINPLPGKNTYWIRIYAYDNNTGQFLGESGAFAFQAEDEGSAKSSSSSSGSTQKASSSQSSPQTTSTATKPANKKAIKTH